MKEDLIKRLSVSDFVEILGDDPQSEDLFVHFTKKPVSEIPITYPFRSNNYALIFVVAGELNILVNLITYNVKKNECIAYPLKTVTQIVGVRPDLKIITISFSAKFIFDNFFNKAAIDGFDFFTATTIPKLKLTATQGKLLKSLAKLLKHYNCLKEDSLFKVDLIRSTFEVILYNYAAIFKKKYPELKIELSRQEELGLRFWNILEENVKKERTVQFYADTLNVTTGYLSKVLKEVTGKTTSRLIDDAVIMEARLLLENPKLSIAQIAEELQFSNQSFFGKYFKKQTGLSPTTYRSKNRK
ncbi:helix-turn-helix domain-containing protein [Maribacter sp.]|uniref:helix-turn-helix domain-containing protein n=1 Tax=Maribacter sp. TaxID=1897614 RepID=UPI0025C22AD4|nr:helix-turn-helix domain-containing protein [Maribacter sp.]